MHHLKRDDAGFTLIELLIVIVILGLIVVPLANVIIGFLHNTNSTTARLSESHDAQIAAAYFSNDVASMGVRDFSDPTVEFPALAQSAEKSVSATGGLYPCGTAAIPTAAIRIAWNDFTVAAGTPTVTRAAYVVETVNGESQLHRLTCAGSAAVTSDVVLAHNVVSATAICSPTPSCADPATRSINLNLVLHNGKSDSTSYAVSLLGQRRQS